VELKFLHCRQKLLLYSEKIKTEGRKEGNNRKERERWRRNEEKRDRSKRQGK
jgi:hypothetical protein